MHIFISYRKRDNIYAVDLIDKFLVEEFGREGVFRDFEVIPLGDNFDQRIIIEIERSNVLLLVVGARWRDLFISKLSSGQKDYVQVEIETALERNIPIVPVFIDGLDTMPSLDELPESIGRIDKLHGVRIGSAPNFINDCSRLVSKLKEQFVKQPLSSVDTKKWCYIPPGRITTKDRFGQDEVRSVNEFYIGKYPVTNSEFEPFIKEIGFLNIEEWYRKRNKDQFGSYRMDELTHALNPVVGVDWYSCLQYCKWYHTQYGYSVTMPYWYQWRRAGSGDKEYSYPWGNKWNNRKCNNSVGQRSRGITVVTAYESVGNVSSFGVVDMAGNVQEWCAGMWTKFKESPITCGGSWISTTKEELIFNSGGLQWFGDSFNFIGFRLVRNIIDEDFMYIDGSIDPLHR